MRSSFPFQFAALLVLGLIVFLLTDSAIAGAVLPAIRAGWSSLFTGLWILHSDERRARARVCAAFCAATGFWQGAAAMLVSVMSFMVVYFLAGVEPDMRRFGATMTTLAAGVAATTLLGLSASLAAVLLEIRVWVHPRLREMVQDDLPSLERLPNSAGFNHAIYVLATSLAFPVLAICSVMLIDFISLTFSLVTFVAGPLLAFLGYLWLSSRIIALRPSDCWLQAGQ